MEDQLNLYTSESYLLRIITAKFGFIWFCWAVLQENFKWWNALFLIYVKFVFKCKVGLSPMFIVMSVMIFAYKRCSVRFYLQLFVGGFMSHLRYLFLLVYSECPTDIVLCFSSSCVPYPMLPVSLDCAFLIGPSVFHLFLLIYIYTFCILTKHHFYKELLNIHWYQIHNEFL